jgi:bifunctional DNA-binding transcriptional regulator/antitoxin component of YhaV-PrlF toxin-antitoxin module
MYAKMTSKNQLTIPKKAHEAIGPATHFEIAVEDGRLMLTPARLSAADAVRRKIAALGITEEDIKQAIKEVRAERRAAR